jgi:filamentous hemagglutinin family protein
MARKARAVSRNRLALAVAAALVPFSSAAQAQPAPDTLPTGASIAAGTATISLPGGGKMQIDQTSDKSILNWQSFSIGAGAWVNFTQPSASSIALNRVVGGNASEIFGRLSANGQVFLSNPSGVLFAPGASVDVGALFATTLSITDSDFLAGNYNFFNAGAAGSVVNGGTITASGYAALAGPQVRNDGLILANSGAVSLAAGERVALDMVGDGLIRVSVDQAVLNASALNAGTIQADGGRVVLTARSANALLDTVVNAGVIRANSLVERNGEIVLDGGSAGTVRQAGALQGAEATLTVTGENIAIDAGSTIDVSAASLTMNAASDIAVNAVVSSRTMVVTAGGVLSLNAGGGRDAMLVSTGGQDVSAGAMVLHAQDGRRALVQNTGGNQSVTVGAGGIGLDVLDGQGIAQIANLQGALTDGAQTVSTSGALNVVGGSTLLGSNNSGVFQSQTGKQTVSAESITLQGALTGSAGGAFISNNNNGGGDQEVQVGGTLSVLAGAVGSRNRAGIVSSGNQTIGGGADITLVGGSSGSGTAANLTSNGAFISANAGTQTIEAGNITLHAGTGGEDTFASINAASQAIHATGDVLLLGGGGFGAANGARIGGPGGTANGPTDLHLSARNVSLTGGATSGAALGSAAGGGPRNDVAVEATGDVRLTSNSAGGVRIGYAPNDPAGGSIRVHADRDIALSGTGRGAVIRSTGDVTLDAGGSISEIGNTLVAAGTLTTTSIGATTLAGFNQVANFAGTSGGAMLLNNTGALSVAGIAASGRLDLFNNGALTVHAGAGQDALVSSVGGQAVRAHSISVVAQDGNRARLGNTGGGDQEVTASSGNIDVIAVGGAGTAKIFNGLPGAGGVGNQTVTATGALNIAGGNSGGTSESLIKSGIFQNTFGTQTVTASSVSLQGADFGSNGGAYITNEGGGGNQAVTATAGGITLRAGGGTGSANRAVIATLGEQTISASGGIELTGGASGSGSGGNNTSNSAAISASAIRTQTIQGGTLTLNAGSGGVDTFAAMFAGTQNISVSGDVTLNGGGAAGGANGARIGGASGSATNLTLAAQNVRLNGGTVSGVALGGSPNGAAQPNAISIHATGDVELNALSGAGVRIGGSPVNGIAGGDISIRADGNIRLNGLTASAAIRTAGDVTLDAGGSISETGNAFVWANTLTSTSLLGSTTLGGPNRIFNIGGSSGGDFTLNNSENLSVGGIASTGTLTLTNIGSLTLGASGGADALITSNGGQTIEADALVVHAQDDRLARIINTGGDQALNVGPGGIELTVLDGRGAAQIVNARGAIIDGTQTVSTPGLLNVLGGSTSDFRGTNSGVFQSQTGKQTVTAGSIELQAAIAPVTLGGAFITSFDGGRNSAQEINVASGTIRLTGGGLGFSNRALISSGGEQTINGNADIFVSGGSSGSGSNATGTNNSASISANRGGTQSISAHDITVQAGSGGTDTNAAIISDHQTITASGDVRVTGGANSGSAAGARIGASGNTTTGTDLTLAAHDVVITGGDTSGAGIGNSAAAGALPSNISIAATGDVILNSGSGNGARIGAPNGGTGGGSIDIDAAGNIVLDGGTHGAIISTAGDLSLHGASISETPNGQILAHSLVVDADGTADLGGSNTVSVFTGNSGSDMLLKTAGALSISGISAGGALSVTNMGAVTLNASGGNDALLASNGGQTIQADALVVRAQDDRLARIVNFGGNQTVDVGPGGIDLTAVDGHGAAQIVNARSVLLTGGVQTVSTSGLLNVLGGSTSDFRGTNSGVFQSQTGKQTVTAGSIELQAAIAPVTLGGALITSFDGGRSSDQEINVAVGTIRLTGGGVGFNNRALISAGGNQTINGNADIFLIGGSSGTGTNAAGLANGAAISANGAGRTQTISAHDITVQAGSGGTDTFAAITGNEQTITASGDVRITGGTNSGTANGARIGASGSSTTGTHLTLTAHDVVLTGGDTSSGAAIGNSGGSALPNTIRISATGDVVLNSGLGNGARIGSANGDRGAGAIDIDAAGSIALNGGAHAVAIRTAGDVTLVAGQSIGEGTNGFIVADGLTTFSAASTLLGGSNHIHRFNATSTGGDVLLYNNEALEVTGLSAFGDATLDNYGDVTISGPWTAGGTTSITVHSDVVLQSTLQSRDVVLTATSGAIQEEAGGAINAESLTTSSVGNTTLAGDNTVSTFSASSQTGSVSLSNTGPLEVTSIQADGGFELSNEGPVKLASRIDGPVTIASHGDLNVTSSIEARDLVLRSDTGNITVGGAAAAQATVVHASGSLTLRAPGDVLVRGSDCTGGAGAQVIADGLLDVEAGSLSLVGGAAPFAPAVAAGNFVNVSTQGVLRLTGGGYYSPALLFSSTGIDLTIGGTLKIDGGSAEGSTARIQTATTDGEIRITFSNPSGEYLVDGLQDRIKHGEDGFYTGLKPAKEGDTFFVDYP